MSSTISILVISTSLRDASRSRVLAEQAFACAGGLGMAADWMDLRDHPLPPCDGEGCFSHPEVAALRPRIEAASAILLAAPVYAYGLSSVARNLVELTGRAWNAKPVGLLCAAGGKGSYMAPLSFANSLMLDYRCPIIPRYVYADGSAFENGAPSGDLEVRIVELVKTAAHWGRVLTQAS
jgi:FMN reductase